jgi:hypothetical protein
MVWSILAGNSIEVMGPIPLCVKVICWEGGTLIAGLVVAVCVVEFVSYEKPPCSFSPISPQLMSIEVNKIVIIFSVDLMFYLTKIQAKKWMKYDKNQILDKNDFLKRYALGV